jgi:hypothetical protein
VQRIGQHAANGGIIIDYQNGPISHARHPQTVESTRSLALA